MIVYPDNLEGIVSYIEIRVHINIIIFILNNIYEICVYVLHT